MHIPGQVDASRCLSSRCEYAFPALAGIRGIGRRDEKPFRRTWRTAWLLLNVYEAREQLPQVTVTPQLPIRRHNIQ